MTDNFDVLDYAESMGCEEIHVLVDKTTKLKAIVAIHNTKLGPSLGGCRSMSYDSTQAAVEDVVRLAQGMTYKAAVAGLNLGGAKAVLLRPTESFDRVDYFKAFGRFVENLNGRYITAGDLGTSVADMDIVETATKHVTGTSAGRFKTHDPSIVTAIGVFEGIKASVKFKLGEETLKGLHCVVQGLGQVGFRLAKYLHSVGARLSVFDIVPERLKRAKVELNARLLSGNEIYTTECEVFVPCAVGGILNIETIPQLKTTIVSGAANTQLGVPEDAQRLYERDILYAPDYVINAGGLIHVAEQYNALSEEKTLEKIKNIYHTLMDIFQRSKKTGCNTFEISEQKAKERFTEGSL